MAEPTNKQKKSSKKNQSNEKHKDNGVTNNRAKVIPQRDPKTLLIENR